MSSSQQSSTALCPADGLALRTQASSGRPWLAAVSTAHTRFALTVKTKPQTAVPALGVRLQGVGTLPRLVAHDCVVLPCPLSIVSLPIF